MSATELPITGTIGGPANMCCVRYPLSFYVLRYIEFGPYLVVDAWIGHRKATSKSDRMCSHPPGGNLAGLVYSSRRIMMATTTNRPAATHSSMVEQPAKTVRKVENNCTTTVFTKVSKSHVTLQLLALRIHHQSLKWQTMILHQDPG